MYAKTPEKDVLTVLDVSSSLEVVDNDFNVSSAFSSTNGVSLVLDPGFRGTPLFLLYLD
jgi:hypothetical protein